MRKISLPCALQFSLKQHAAAADIDDDEELKSIMLSLSELNEKIEAVKLSARLRRASKN